MVPILQMGKLRFAEGGRPLAPGHMLVKSPGRAGSCCVSSLHGPHWVISGLDCWVAHLSPCTAVSGPSARVSGHLSGKPLFPRTGCCLLVLLARTPLDLNLSAQLTPLCAQGLWHPSLNVWAASLECRPWKLARG